ncbi:MAG: hypothetical protein ACI4ER_01220 [Suilimivivens sp.]
MSRIRKERRVDAFGGIHAVIFSPTDRDRVKVKPETRERMHMELMGTRTFEAL